jgi:hypothetical protein
VPPAAAPKVESQTPLDAAAADVDALACKFMDCLGIKPGDLKYGDAQVRCLEAAVDVWKVVQAKK